MSYLSHSPQFSSSVLSPQSSVPSQTCRSSTQASLLHLVMPAGHSLPREGTNDEERERKKRKSHQKRHKGDQLRFKVSWDPPVFTWWDSPGRAQSKNSSWSMATSPLWPWERCEWNRIWNAEEIRPRKMLPSLQLRTLVASGRHTTASWESWWTMEAHKGVEPRPVWSNNTGD